MKKHFKLALHALSIAAALSLANGNIALAEDAPTEMSQPEVKGKKKKGKKAKGAAKHAKKNKKGKKGIAGQDGDGIPDAEDKDADGDGKPDQYRSPEHIRKHIAARMEAWQKDEDSLASKLAKAKETDPAALTPKTLPEIGMIADEGARRLELFKFQEAAQGKEYSAEDKAAYKQLVLAEIERIKTETKQVRELLGNMIHDKNYALMSEEEIHEAFKSLFEHEHAWHGKGERHKDKKGAAHGKEHKAKAGKKGKKANIVDADGDGKPDVHTKKKKNKKKGKKAKAAATAAAAATADAAAATTAVDADGDDQPDITA